MRTGPAQSTGLHYIALCLVLMRPGSIGVFQFAILVAECLENLFRVFPDCKIVGVYALGEV